MQTDREFILPFTRGDQGILSRLLAAKLISGNRIKSQQGGLDGVLNGLKELEEGKVRLLRDLWLRLTNFAHRRCRLRNWPIPFD